MRKDKQAQITICDLDKMTKRDLRLQLSWLRKKVRVLERQEHGPWLVTRKQYAPVFSFSLMK